MRTNKLLAVVHTIHPDQALLNAVIAEDNGADGIFLIDHSGGPQWQVRNCYNTVREEFPNWWVGINFLSGEIAENIDFHLPRKKVDAFWSDDSLYSEGRRDPLKSSRLITERLTNRFGAERPLFFGGLDFKGQVRIEDLGTATKLLGGVIDVVTTSGPATGSPPTAEKIALMRRAAPEAKIAVASGMTSENVDPFLEYVDYFLVATGISKDFHYLDPVKVRQMADKMRR